MSTVPMIFIYFSMLILILALPILYYFSRTKILTAEREKQTLAFKAAQEAEERQRQSISSTLHDQVIAELTVLVQNYELSIRALEQNKLSTDSLRADKLIAIKSIESVREVALALIPQELINYGLIAALGSYLKRQRFENSSALINTTSFDKVLPFNKSAEVSIYRLVLEIITNLRKHEKIRELSIELKVENSDLVISFNHDGNGITDEEIRLRLEGTKGLGLKSIQSRLFTLNATIKYLQSSAGSSIIAKIPIKDETN